MLYLVLQFFSVLLLYLVYFIVTMLYLVLQFFSVLLLYLVLFQCADIVPCVTVLKCDDAVSSVISVC
jgi:hypothetical protein